MIEKEERGGRMTIGQTNKKAEASNKGESRAGNKNTIGTGEGKKL